MAARIGGTVGTQGANAPADVRAVQQLLGARAAMLGLPPLAATGTFDEATERAIRTYQLRVAGRGRATGRLSPGDAVLAMLLDDGPAGRQREAVRARRASAQLSGAAWWEANSARFHDSRSLAELRPAFASALGRFVAALERAGVLVTVESTRTNAQRAWLQRTAGAIARNAIQPEDVAPDHAVGILWDHGEDQRSEDAAQAMVALMGGGEGPPADSPEVTGSAARLDIRWYGPIAVRDAHGAAVPLDRPRFGARNLALHRVARSYGVVKAPTDPLLWLSAAG